MPVTSERSFFKSLLSRDITPIQRGVPYFVPFSEIDNIFNGNNYLADFLEIPEVNAIINIRARAMASWRLQMLSKATGLEVSNNQSVVRILKNPNWFQAQKEFWKHSSTLHDIYGNEFLYFLTPVGMPNTYKGLFSLDPSKVKIKYKTKEIYFNQSNNDAVEYYYVQNDGTEILLDKSNIIHLNDNRVVSKDILKGTSKLKALQAPLRNIREAYKKRNIILKMPVGIFTNGQKDDIGQAVPFLPGEKEENQKALKTHGANPIITNLALNYSNMTINAKAMGLFDEVKADVEKICDSFGVPFEMLANEKGTTFTNLKEAKRQFYEDTIIPDAQEKIDALNMKFDGKTWEVVADFKHLAIFSENQKEKAIALKQLVEALSKALADGAITVEQYKNELTKFGI